MSVEYENFMDNATVLNQTDFDVVAEQIAGILNVYYTPILVFLGVLGNVTSVIVFYKSKLRFQSTSQYLSALALSDTIFLLQLLPPWMNALQITGLFHTNGLCQAIMYVSYVTCCLSSWLVVSFTVERCVAVLYPLRRNSMCTVTRARHVILMITATSLLLNLPILKFSVPSKNDCNIDVNFLDHAAVFNMIDTAITFTLPLTVIIILNSWIMVGVWRLERARHQLIKAGAQAGARTGARRVARLVGCPRSQQRITNMLLTVSTVFVVLNLPAYTMRILAYALHRSFSEYNGRWAVLQQMALLFFNTNFGINFVLYCLSGQNFRRALLQLLPCLRGRARRARCIAVRRPTPYHPAPITSVSTSFVSCTEATTNYAVVSAGPPDGAGAGADGEEGGSSRRDLLISRWVYNNLQRTPSSRSGRPSRPRSAPIPVEIELHEIPRNREA